MSEAHRSDIERSGVELEFDTLWKPVLGAYSHLTKYIETSRLRWPASSNGPAVPPVIFSTEIKPELGEVTDQEIFGKYVDIEAVTANVTKYVRVISMKKTLEAAVVTVNDYLGFDPDRKDASSQGYTGLGPTLYLQGTPSSNIHGHNPKRTVRLFGFSVDGTVAVVKRFGDSQTSLEEIGYWKFCYGDRPNFRPTLNPGDYDVIPEAETIETAIFQ